ncbi:MAG: hydroxyacylglutathione hydrolase [Cocleimonas sp.]|nr:hydroxyacylglutathione hydrolase [Cocleimonas sp.]
MSCIITVPAFSDNYIWLICNKRRDDNKQFAAIVDPGDAAPVITALEKDNIQPIVILITHFHHDHVGGISALLERYPDLPVYGPASENIPHITHPLKGDEKLKFDAIDTSFQVMNVHGHTAGHIAYYAFDSLNNDRDNSTGRLFCGDTLFAGGCGRVFNGTMKDLHDSLHKISQLPEDTLIYCAHEYTLDNLGFAQWVEPDSGDIVARIDADRALIDNDQATVPSLLSLELATNPFMRTHLPHVATRVAEATGKSLNNSTEVFTAMREWKDSEYD